MECKKCKGFVSENDITVSETEQGQLDILIECPECGNQFGTFVDIDSLTEY